MPNISISIYVKNIAKMALGMLCMFSAPAWAVIEFNDAYNFRDFRVNPPLTYNQGADLLIFGIFITDSDTGTVPAGAIVRAENQVSGEQFVLRRSGTEYFEVLPYTADRAAGEWIVEVNSNVGSASALIPAFGIGPGSGQMPTVENLMTTATEPQPKFTWTLPLDLQTQNDGNVDRIRARILDSNDVWVVDDKFDPTATATMYESPAGAITHNGAYVAHIMVEGFTPFNRSRNFTTFVVDNVGTGGVPASLDSIYHARDFRGDNSVGWTPGDRQAVCIEANPFVDTYVYAEQSGLVLQSYPQRDAPQEFCSVFAFDDALTGAWNMVAWNGAQETSVLTHALGPLDQLPLITNIRIVPDDLTPTIRWDLPDINAPYDEIAIGLFDDVTDFRLFRFGPGQDQIFDILDPSATMYKFPAGVLEEGGRYVVRVMLVDRDIDDNPINRAITFFNFTPIPGTDTKEFYLPTLDEGGIYNFDFDVTEAVPVTIDPEVTVGYIYEIGEGNPRFASVELPLIGDGLYDLTIFDDMGNDIHMAQIAALAPFDLTQIDSTGIAKFEVRGIEVSAGLDPLDTTAFMTTLTFASSGRFTGTMTPIVLEVGDPTNVTIDIKPGSGSNSVNPRSKGVIPLAVLGSADFDATQVFPTTALFGPDGASPAHNGHLEDVNDDGFMDMVLHFKTQKTGIDCGDTEATLVGQIMDGTLITGTDAVKTVGCKKAK